MKKALSLIFGLFFILSANAQQFFHARGDFDHSFRTRFGFTMGAALSNAVPSSKSNYNTGGAAGFSFGITYNRPVGDRLSIGAEALYSQKGYAANTLSGRFSQSSQFLDVPVFAKYSMGRRLNVFAGPQVSYMLASSNSYNAGFEASTMQYYQYSGVRTFFAGVVGAGVDITDHVNLNARYAIDIKGTNANGSAYVPAYKRQAMQLAFGYRF